MRSSYLAILIALVAATFAWHAEAGGGKGETSDTKVKAAAMATKPDADGKQTVTITLTIDKGWHIYANPVKLDFLEEAQTTVTIVAKEKLRVDVKYPLATTKAEKKSKYDVYEGVVKIQATVVRTKGDVSPLEVSVVVNACNANTCLLQGTLKLNVP